jgi:DNA-binding transcriptional ArsR family regulator
MAARLLVAFALLAALTPVAAEPLTLPDAHASFGPVSAHLDDDDVQVDTGLPLPVGVDRTVALPLLPDLSVENRPATAAEGEDSLAPASTVGGPLQALRQVPPQAIAVGSPFLAALLTLAAWLSKPAVGLFSRIEDDALAAHPLRRQALDLIAANPGVTVQGVRRSLGVAWGTAVYHLGRLERAGLVAVRHREGRRGHWPLGQAPPRDALAPTGEALARLVRERPGLAQTSSRGWPASARPPRASSCAASSRRASCRRGAPAGPCCTSRRRASTASCRPTRPSEPPHRCEVRDLARNGM